VALPIDALQTRGFLFSGYVIDLTNVELYEETKARSLEIFNLIGTAFIAVCIIALI
jgi:hypothetical protein